MSQEYQARDEDTSVRLEYTSVKDKDTPVRLESILEEYGAGRDEIQSIPKEQIQEVQKVSENQDINIPEVQKAQNNGIKRK